MSMRLSPAMPASCRATAHAAAAWGAGLRRCTRALPSSARIDTFVLLLPQEALRGKPVTAQPARLAPRVARQAVCSAQQERPALASTLAAAALAAAVTLGQVDAAQADVSGLTPCSESKQFAKRQKNELKALDKRLKLVSDWIQSSLCLIGKGCLP